MDGLRAISIIFVLLGHLSGTRNFINLTGMAATYANFGVHVFFVISGFLITSLLLNEHDKANTISLKEFYKRRALRIFPAAYAFVIAMTVTYWVTLRWPNILSAATYTTNCYIYFDETGRMFMKTPWFLGHLWSLSVEEQFYLLWPALLLLFFRSRVKILVGAMIAAPVVRAVFGYLWGGQATVFPFPSVMDALATGCLLAIIRPKLEKYQHILSAPWFTLIPVITFLLPLTRMISNAGWRTVGLTIAHAGIALTIDNAIRRKYWILNWRPMVWVGVLSYSLYLWQQPFLNRHSDSVWTAFPQNIILAFLFASLSHYLVEKPFMSLRKSAKVGAQPAEAAAKRPESAFAAPNPALSSAIVAADQPR